MFPSLSDAFIFSLQMMCTVLLLGCSIMMTGLSLMGLSRGVREDQNYQALSQNLVTCTTEDVRHEYSPEREASHSSVNRGTAESLSCVHVSSMSVLSSLLLLTDVCCSEPMPDMIAGHVNDSPGPSAGHIFISFISSVCH